MLGLSRQAAVYSSVVYGAFFAHFHAAFGFEMSGRLPAVSASLLLVLLYLKAALRSLRWLLLFGICSLFWVAATPSHGRESPGVLKVSVLPHAVIPFVAAGASFLQPIQAALQMDSARANYPIPPQIGTWSVLLVGLLVIRSWALWRAQAKVLLLLFAWVLFCTRYFLNQTGRGPPVFPSEDFILISPLFSIVFAETCVYFSEKIQAACRASRRTSGLALAGVFLALCLPNLLAIRVSLFRGKLANGFSSYDDLKALRADAFAGPFEQGLLKIGLGQEAEALDLLQRAARARPFLLQYLLGPCQLSDLRWMTGSLDLRSWVRQIGEEHAWSARVPSPKDRQVLEGIQREMSDYALSLFCIAYLERNAGHLESSRTWLSQLRYLERNPERLSFWIGQLPQVQKSSPLREFTVVFQDPTYLREPLPWRKDDYGFGRFVMRLLLRWNVRSGGDRQMEFGI